MLQWLNVTCLRHRHVTICQQELPGRPNRCPPSPSPLPAIAQLISTHTTLGWNSCDLLDSSNFGMLKQQRRFSDEKLLSYVQFNPPWTRLVMLTSGIVCLCNQDHSLRVNKTEGWFGWFGWCQFLLSLFAEIKSWKTTSAFWSFWSSWLQLHQLCHHLHGTCPMPDRRASWTSWALWALWA